MAETARALSAVTSLGARCRGITSRRYPFVLSRLDATNNLKGKCVQAPHRALFASPWGGFRGPALTVSRNHVTMAPVGAASQMLDLKMVSVEFHNDSDGSISKVLIPEGTKITEAATMAGVTIPTLCHHPRLSPVGKCGVCVCSVEGGHTPTQLACSSVCRPNDDGSPLKVHVHGTTLNGLANAAFSRNLDALTQGNQVMERFKAGSDFSPRGSSEIQGMAEWMNKANIDESSNSITYDPSLCIGCSRCVRACDQIQAMKVLEAPLPSANAPAVGIAQAAPCMTTRAGRPLKDTDCISCGQCTSFCPTGAIKEVDHTARVMQALLDPEKIVVLQTAPSVKVTLSEMFGGAPGEGTSGRLVGAAKACGFNFVFDTNLAADLTIMEEANELLKRIEVAQTGTKEEKEKMPLPMFTSCCPGWINLVEQLYPDLMPHISTCRSPMGMLSSMIRNHWWPNQYERARVSGFSPGDEIDQSKLFVVAAMPCTAKKDEMARPQFQMANGQYETDAVLTVRELARLIELRGVAKRDDYESFKRIPKLFYDNPFGEGTGAAVLFGATGGVMEAALRTAADVLNGKSLDAINYEAVRGLSGIKEATVMLGPNKETALNVAVCHQMRNVREFLEKIEQGESNYHFVEIMTCEGGCLGGGGLPQSRDPTVMKKRMESLYSKDERMVIRKSHENQAVQELYKNVLGHPLSHTSHEWLHTNYFARPRKALLDIKAQSLPETVDLQGDTANTVCIVYGTQTGTTAQAAKEIKMELQSFISRSKVTPEPNVALIAANSLPPDKLLEKVRGAMASLFVTCTYGEGEFPETMLKLWDYLENNCDSNTFPESSLRYGVFGLGSSQYSCGDQFNRSARRLDARLEALGGQRLLEAGLGDDQAPEHYNGELEKWMEQLQPKLFGKVSGGRSYLDPPKPLFQLSLAPGLHGDNFRPLPPNYNFVKMKSAESVVSEDSHRPTAVFSFDLSETGLEYNVGDHLAILPRNPASTVNRVIDLYGSTLTGKEVLSVEPVDPLGESPFPPTLTTRELLTQYLDFCGRPSRNFFRQLLVFARSTSTRKQLRALCEQKSEDNAENLLESYTADNTYADVLCEFAETALPPFEYLLSMVPVITPRLYSIASSPLHEKDCLDLLVVLNQWEDGQGRVRTGLTTQSLFGMEADNLVAIQIKKGLLMPPTDPEAPILMFGLGTGVAPFRGFLQHRQALMDQGVALGPATLYVQFRHKNQDYYLEKDWQRWLETGALTKLHTIFSRDIPGKRGRIADDIKEHPLDMTEALQLDVTNWKDNQIHAYYCGPAMGIPDKIQESMEAAIATSLNEEEAKAFMEKMVKKDEHFHVECF